MNFGSVTDLTPACAGAHVVVGSHGGAITARYAFVHGVASVIFHDAGIGRDAAGVQSLALLDAAGIPAAAVGHMTARIGDPADMLLRGRITRFNHAAAALGAQGEMAADALAALFARSPMPRVPPDLALPPAPRRVELGGAVALDTASDLGHADDGRVVVTGSHGGIPGNLGVRAAKATPAFIAFNDAGRGIEDAGVRRLPLLAAQGIAAVAVDAMSAAIGDAVSSYETGVISVANDVAVGLGILPGLRLKDLVDRLVNL